MTKRSGDTKTLHDPFLNKEVEISHKLIDRLRGRYACGPTLPNGEPEFGWRQFETPPVNHEAADEIERLEARCKTLTNSAKINGSVAKQRGTENERLRASEQELGREVLRLRCVGAALRAAQWQPIGTAPIDGTKFLAVTGKGKMRVDWFDATMGTSQNLNERGDDRYTHWMTLPSLPDVHEQRPEK